MATASALPPSPLLRSDPAMKLSKLILRLQAVMREHGDLEVYTPDADIAEVIATPARDGVQRFVDGIAEDPNELILELLPGR